MISDISKYIENKKVAKTLCEELLGLGRLDDWAIFYEKHQDEIKLVKQALLVDFCETQNFTDEQLKYYRTGLNAFPLFFADCQAEKEIQENKDKPQTKDTRFE